MVSLLFPFLSIEFSYDKKCHMMQVYPGKQVGGSEADMMAANELNAHASLQVIL